MFSRLDGYSVIVTGASKGIGKGIARVLGSAGASVLITGRHERDLQACAAELAESGVPVATYVGDVASREDCADMAAAAVEAFGAIDVLCANAGVFPEAPLADMRPDQLDEVLAVNFKGTVFATQAVLPELQKSGRGRIIVTSSITGPMTGFPGWCHYGASKAAQLGFMRTAAMELAKQSITINAVLPGNVYTEGLEEMGEEYLDGMRSSIPLGELGAVEDIGYAALFLATPQARYITGTTIVVDGGQTIPESADALAAI